MISELKELDDLRALERLFADIWGRPGESPIVADVLMALVHSGNYVAGAHLDGGLVGGLVGWLGGSPPDHLLLHSHILGVVAEGRGLGFDLKQHQRLWCLERGVKVMEWTFDPLVRRNAYFNFNKLGAEAREYLVNFYGEMTDGINAGESRTGSSSAGGWTPGRLLRRPPAVRTIPPLTTFSAGRSTRCSRWVRVGSRCQDRQALAWSCARRRRTSSRCGAAIRGSHAHGGSPCAVHFPRRSTPATQSRA